MQIIDTFQNRLKKAMEINKFKQVDLVNKTHLDKTLINKYLAGIMKAKQDKLTILSEALNVNEVWLMGYDVPMERMEYVTAEDWDNDNKYVKTINPDGSISYGIATKENAIVFVYGTIPAGIPMECIEDIIDTEEISADMLKGGKQYFGLKVKGDSMYPEYLDGDTLILEKVDDCESGDDCVVMVNGNDGTFKRVFKNENGIVLQPLNNAYAPMPYTNEQIENLPVKIIGVVNEIRRKKRK